MYFGKWTCASGLNNENQVFLIRIKKKIVITCEKVKQLKLTWKLVIKKTFKEKDVKNLKQPPSYNRKKPLESLQIKEKILNTEKSIKIFILHTKNNNQLPVNCFNEKVNSWFIP